MASPGIGLALGSGSEAGRTSASLTPWLRQALSQTSYADARSEPWSALPPALREQASAILPKLVSTAPTSPGYFAVLMTSINVMQDQITRAWPGSHLT